MVQELGASGWGSGSVGRVGRNRVVGLRFAVSTPCRRVENKGLPSWAKTYLASRTKCHIPTPKSSGPFATEAPPSTETLSLTLNLQPSTPPPE